MATRSRTHRRVTLRDVADASGVSPATVSFVLNEVPNQTISESTKLRVRETAKRLGYVPNGIARALMEGSSRIVVLNLDAAREGNYSENFIRGADKELSLYGFALLVRHGKASPQSAKQVLDAIGPRAVINFGANYMNGHELEDSGGGWKNGMAAHVLIQFQYLVSKGHRHIALALPADEPLAYVRVRFADEVAKILDIDQPLPLVIPGTVDPATHALGVLRQERPDVTAVAAFDDVTALVVLAACRSLGLRVPEDLAVIGYDESPHSALSYPPLTTVLADGEAHGRLAARRALGLDLSDLEVRPGQVIERGSV